MKTTTPAVNAASTMQADLNDIVFEHKNKEYGAYVLRKAYARFLTYAVMGAGLTFILSISSPLIFNIIKEMTGKRENLEVLTNREVDLGKLEKEKDLEEKIIEKPKEQIVKSTYEYVAPVIKADEEVKVAYEAPKEDKEVGKTTQTADPTSINLDEMTLPDANSDPNGGKPVEEKVEVFKFVEEMPTFPGGQDALLAFFATNVKYPEIARRAGVEGKVFVQFVVGKDGNVTQSSIAKGIGAGCDEEAIRVTKMMPKWNPGKQNGRPVRVQVIVPIQFKLQ